MKRGWPKKGPSVGYTTGPRGMRYNIVVHFRPNAPPPKASFKVVAPCGQLSIMLALLHMKRATHMPTKPTYHTPLCPLLQPTWYLTVWYRLGSYLAVRLASPFDPRGTRQPYSVTPATGQSPPSVLKTCKRDSMADPVVVRGTTLCSRPPGR